MIEKIKHSLQNRPGIEELVNRNIQGTKRIEVFFTHSESSINTCTLC